MRQTLTDMACKIDEQLRIEDPTYLLEIQARDAVKTIIGKFEERDVEVVKLVNIRDVAKVLYEVPLSLISRTILVEKGVTEDEITVSDVTSVSKTLKNIFEMNLGFKIRIGKKRRRVVTIPADWVDVEDKHPKTLSDFTG